METTLTPEAGDAICRHMNDDHADAIVAYARVFGKVAGAQSATMRCITGTAMELAVETATGPVLTRIAFDHVLADGADARDTLIAMARHAMTDA
jgi:putative heme iron utilization protein